jgi:integrase
MKIFLEINQIKQWLDLAKKEPRDFALFNLAFTTGLRVSDLLLLQRADLIDKDKEIVRVLRLKIKKTQKWIDRPLREDCRAAVKKYLATRADSNPSLFPPKQACTRYGCNDTGPMCRWTAHKLYKKYLRMMFPESMLDGCATHTLRRSMAKIISQKTGRIEPASKYLGHRSIASTSAYIDMESWEQKANEATMSIEI